MKFTGFRDRLLLSSRARLVVVGWDLMLMGFSGVEVRWGLDSLIFDRESPTLTTDD